MLCITKGSINESLGGVERGWIALPSQGWIVVAPRCGRCSIKGFRSVKQQPNVVSKREPRLEPGTSVPHRLGARVHCIGLWLGLVGASPLASLDLFHSVEIAASVSVSSDQSGQPAPSLLAQPGCSPSYGSSYRCLCFALSPHSLRQGGRCCPSWHESRSLLPYLSHSQRSQALAQPMYGRSKGCFPNYGAAAWPSALNWQVRLIITGRKCKK